MPPETLIPIRERARRAAPDLLASDELLACLLVGLENLRRRLETAQKEQQRAATAKVLASARDDSALVRPELAEPALSDRQWYYQAEPAAALV